MDIRDAQRLLSAGRYYNGAIDGIQGYKTNHAVDVILARRSDDLVRGSAAWDDRRRLFAAGQLILKYAGFDPGAIDGLPGNRTIGALLEYETFHETGERLVLEQREVINASLPRTSAFPSQSQCRAFYGATQQEVESQLVMIDLPYTMRLDWDTGVVATRARLHRKCAPSAVEALKDSLAHYGIDRLRDLGLDRTAGTYIWRNMRGGANLSTHASGAAWDFYARPNGLTTRCPDALFCSPQYKTWFDIWESHGWLSLGRVIGRDWMHLQATKDLK